MVVKSIGTDSELLALTAEQKKKTGELAEKFDTAALIYNITALEKLRWTLKNSDTPRALLDALLLRFALSEHFLNVDELLSKLHGGTAADVKKKQQTNIKDETRDDGRPSFAKAAEGKQKTEDRGQTTDDGQRMTDDKGQMTDDRTEMNSTHRDQTTSRGKNEIINDPAVKTVIIGLDATITSIEETDN
jgi:hypothetical protein